MITPVLSTRVCFDLQLTFFHLNIRLCVVIALTYLHHSTCVDYKVCRRREEIKTLHKKVRAATILTNPYSSEVWSPSATTIHFSMLFKYFRDFEIPVFFLLFPSKQTLLFFFFFFFFFVFFCFFGMDKLSRRQLQQNTEKGKSLALLCGGGDTSS